MNYLPSRDYLVIKLGRHIIGTLLVLLTLVSIGGETLNFSGKQPDKGSEDPYKTVLAASTCEGSFRHVSAPLTEMGNSSYIRMNGQTYTAGGTISSGLDLSGGLYRGGFNERPPAHEFAGVEIANNLNPINGKIVVLSIGMSNTSSEFGDFIKLAQNDSSINPDVAIVNGAQPGKTAVMWGSSPSAEPWNVAKNRLTSLTYGGEPGITPEQVQVVWIKLANDMNNASSSFPTHTTELKEDIKQTVLNAKVNFPNLKLAYLSSRTRSYGYWDLDSPTFGYLNPEPAAFETGYSVKWLIEEQISNTTADLNYVSSQGVVDSPWLSWGPYLWVNSSPRADGFTWTQADLTNDCTHPSQSGRDKVASELLRFFKTDTTTKPWFLGEGAITVGGGPGNELTGSSPNSCTYVVSKSGGDDFTSVQDGIDALNPGDTLCIRSGTYVVSKVSVDGANGTASSPITIRSFDPGNKAVIDGGYMFPPETSGCDTTSTELCNNTNWYAPLLEFKSSYVDVEDLEVRNSSGRCVTIHEGADHVTLKGLHVHDCWKDGVKTFGDFTTVEDSEIHETIRVRQVLNPADSEGYIAGKKGRGGEALTAKRADNAVFRNNLVYHSYGEGIISSGSSRVLVENNTVYDTKHPLLYMGGAIDVTFDGNLVYRTNDKTFWRNKDNPGNCIATTDEKEGGRSSDTINIINNIAINCGTNYRYWLDKELPEGGLINTTIANNTFVNATAPDGEIFGIQIGSSPNHKNSKVVNNLVYQTDGVAIKNGDSSGEVEVSNNLVFGGGSIAGSVSGTITGNPLLSSSNSPVGAGTVNPNSYKISSGSSAAANSATVLSQVTKDYFGAFRGNNPDIGAHEYGGTVTAPYCGDSVCNGNESCSTCSQDCGACSGPTCGDGSCNGDETCSTCPGDCGSCGGGAICGDNVCNGSETCSTCPGDCGSCPEPPVGYDAALEPVADTMAKKSKKTTNYGNSSSLGVDGSVYTDDPISISFLKFDLGQLEDRAIETARLTYQITDSIWSATSATHYVKKVLDNSWQEDTLTWNNMPSTHAVVATKAGVEKHEWVEVDVTSYANDFRGSIISFGLDMTSRNGTHLYSKETGSAPKLLVTYEDDDEGPGDGTSGDNLIKNPSFEIIEEKDTNGNGTADLLVPVSWMSFSDGPSTFTVSEDATHLDVSGAFTVNSTNSSIQLYQKDINLEANTDYSLIFDAKSSSGSDLDIKIHSHDFPYSTYIESGSLSGDVSGETVNLQQDWTTFQIDFSTNDLGGEASVSNARLRFWLAPHASAGETYYFDNVRLVLGGVSPEEPLEAIEGFELTTIADTYAKVSNKNENYGTANDVGIDGAITADTPIKIGFFKFNLTDYSKVTVNKAVLRYKVRDALWSATSAPHYVSKVLDNSWTETGLTWNNMPDLGGVLGTVPSTSKNEVIEVDVTEYVDDSLGGAISFGLYMTSRVGTSFYSRESGELAPTLIINGGVIEPSSQCGDGICNGFESCTSCSADCGACSGNSCGDGICTDDETCSSCSADCGECPPAPTCGDGSCNGNETCATCFHDCGSCPPVSTDDIVLFNDSHMDAESTRYDVEVNGTDIYTHFFDNGSNHGDTHYAHFACSGTAEVKVTHYGKNGSGETINAVDTRINPSSEVSNINISGNQLTFNVQCPQQLHLDINRPLVRNDWNSAAVPSRHRLFIFAEPIETNVPDPNGNGVVNVKDYINGGDIAVDIESAIAAAGSGIVYFPSGEYALDSQVDINKAENNNLTLYLEPGVYIKRHHGSAVSPPIRLEGVKGVTIRGYGVVESINANIAAVNATDFEIDGPILRNLACPSKTGFFFLLFNTRSSRVNNVKTVLLPPGCPNKGGRAAFVINSAEDLLIENSFTFSWEDANAVKSFDWGGLHTNPFPNKNVTVRNMISWKGNVIGTELFESVDTSKGIPVDGITYENMELVKGHIVIHSTRVNDLQNVTFNNIHIIDSGSLHFFRLGGRLGDTLRGTGNIVVNNLVVDKTYQGEHPDYTGMQFNAEDGINLTFNNLAIYNESTCQYKFISSIQDLRNMGFKNMHENAKNVTFNVSNPPSLSQPNTRPAHCR